MTGLQDSDAKDATIGTLEAIEHPIAKTAQVMVEICSFAGSGNVLKVQTMLHHCDEHIDMSKEKEKEKDKDKKEKGQDGKENAEPKQDDTFQAFAVLGIALVAMGEDIGAEMSLRQFNHLVRLLLTIPSIWLLTHNVVARCITANLSSGRPFHWHSGL
jgi:26S proteasome regulatory subunit N1